MSHPSSRLPFGDRFEAGSLLGSELRTRHFPADTLVLALPRGGVPVAFEVALALNAPLDVEIVRKLGVPWQPELAMGALAGGRAFLDHTLISQLGIAEQQVKEVIAAEAATAARQAKVFRNNRPSPDLANRPLIVVDDGLATGASMIAAVNHLKSAQPAAITVAVPVASNQACLDLRNFVDDCVCLATPDPFYSVGTWYRDFTQVTDAEVIALLQKQSAVAPPRF